MNKIQNQKKHYLFSKDENVLKLLKKLKEDIKLYSKIEETLNILGNFNNKIEVQIYDIIENEEKMDIRLWCEDDSENIFIFFAKSSNKKNLMIIDQENNFGTFKYDISLSKKFNLTTENISLIRISNIYNFKYGRLVTDEQSFYSLFLGNDIAYQININFLEEKNISVEELLKTLNKLEIVPSFMNFINIFETLIDKNDVKFDEMSLCAYKNFELIGKMNLNQNNNTSSFSKQKFKKF